MNNSLSIVCLVAAMIVCASCKKTDAPADIPSLPPAVTPIGTPVGSPNTKNIGTAGGSIMSVDGRIELVFPAGALSTNTNISIQPVANTCPGGIGLSYHLMPDGTTFSKPVSLIYHYSKEEVNGTLPYLLYIAYQDDAMHWKADYKKRNVDTVAKTVTLATSHFSIWSMGDRLHLFCTPAEEELYANDTREIRAVLSDPPPPSSDDDLSPLPTETALPADRVSNWKVNGHSGNAADGTIDPHGNTATYTAPADIKQKRTVQISTEVKYDIVMFNNGQVVASINKLILFIRLTLLPSMYEFTVNIDFKDNGVAGFAGQTYEDKASFDLTIQKTKDAMGDLTIVALGANFKNYAPTVTPLTKTYPTPLGTFTWTWVPDATGETNITGINVSSFNDSSVNLEFVHTGTLSPGNTWQSTNPTTSGTIASQPLGGSYGIPAGTRVKFKAETQRDFVSPNGDYVIVLTPK